MLTLTVTIEGKKNGDLVEALAEVKRLIDRDFLSGNNSNDDGSFSFRVSGEEEESEEEEE